MDLSPEHASWLPDDLDDGEALQGAVERIGAAIALEPAEPPAEVPWVALPERPGARVDPAARAAALERLLVWARAGGATWDGIAFRADAHGDVQAHATRAIAAGERVLTLPRALMIVDDAVAPSPRGTDPRDALAAWLPGEARSETSRWRAYLAALPTALPELPMFHAERELAAIAGTAAHAMAGADSRDVRAAYERLSADARAHTSLADFAWGCAITKSRGYHAPGTFDHRIALLPLVDLFDHGHGDLTWEYAGGELAIVAERAIGAGEPVHHPYGERGNAWLFVHHGFTLAANPDDAAELQLDRAADPVTAVAAHVLWKLPLARAARVPIACRFDGAFVRALSIARWFACATPADRARAFAAGLAPDGDLPWLGAELEAAAFGVMADAARRAIAAIAAPVGEPATRWDRDCAAVRAGERAVLQHVVDACEAIVPHLRARDATRVQAAAAAIAEDATGAPRLVRQYLSALASVDL